MTRRLASLGFAAALAIAAIGCNETEEGAEGLVRFTPDACDLQGSGCDFDDGLAAGGTTNVWISGTEGVSTAGFDLESDDPTVLTVTPIADVAGRPTWSLYGAGEGVARLYAVDADGADVDFLEVAVQEIDGLHMVQTVGQAVGPTADASYDEIWQLNANEETWFFVEPTLGGGPIMGVLEYVTDVDAALVDYILQDSNISGGLYKINAPAGDYELSVTSDNGTYLDVLFQVQ